jgi:hypothetical protein
MSTKVRKTLTLDSDVVDMFSADDPDSLSGAINTVLQAERERRERRASLAVLVADLTALHGEPDRDEVEKFKALLG